MTALLDRGEARFGLLIALIVAFYLTYRNTVWLPRPGRSPEEVTLLPVSPVVWHSVGWLVFTALLLLLFLSGRRPHPAESDLPLRRLTLGALFAVYAVTGLERVATGRAFGLPPAALVAGLIVAVVVAGALIRRPPSTAWLLGACLGAGVVLRLALIALVRPDAAFADNLPAVALSLERLRGGLTPYAIHNFGDHTNPMPYLPLTFLSYLPAQVLGMDIRLTNVVLATALTAVCLLLLRALPLPTTTRRGLALAVGLLFLLPERLSNDLYTAWSPFNLLLVLAFALLVLARFRTSAVVYGASLAAMPVGWFVAPPLFLLALRTRPLREVLLLGAIVAGVGGAPIVLFLLWDIEAFRTAFLFGTTGLWEAIAAGTSEEALMLWHGWIGSGLLAVQAVLVLVVVALSWTRLRTMGGLIALGAVLYIGLIITGPHIAQYMTNVVPYLALLHEAVRASVVSADREFGRLRAGVGEVESP